MKKLLILSMLAVAPAMFGIYSGAPIESEPIGILQTFAVPLRGRTVRVDSQFIRHLNAVISQVNELTEAAADRHPSPYLEQPQSSNS